MFCTDGHARCRRHEPAMRRSLPDHADARPDRGTFADKAAA
ncbi:hypothetical protein Lokhon_01111 [Limimaricola hongkongensis DSM 17492]|uniref:Uncharacterized protein n=1 Tax=Limimaricola hongkongensis DSM 17492 TaxID=1122180 RepID=A0A017HCT1_9RHOB|nr:hypothetical protein Lokhon_01111 [Limimaricola hongkongensis DSM 17492]